MDLNPDEWRLILADPATNYHVDDHAVAVVHDDKEPARDQPVLLLDAEHIETGVKVRLTARIPIALVPHLAGEFTVMAEDLRQRGALT